MTIEFGDVEPEDVYAAGGEPDPDRVAERLHELRAYVENLIGRPLDRFDRLSDSERSLARSIAGAVIAWIVENEPDDPETVARELHAVRRAWSGGTLPEWEDLPDEQREIGVDLMRHLVEWLEREGTIE